MKNLLPRGVIIATDGCRNVTDAAISGAVHHNALQCRYPGDSVARACHGR
jgi:hypothetical protein